MQMKCQYSFPAYLSHLLRNYLTIVQYAEKPVYYIIFHIGKQRKRSHWLFWIQAEQPSPPYAAVAALRSPSSPPSA